MSHLKRLFVLMAVVFSFSLLAPLEAYAWSPFGAVECKGEATKSAVCADRGLSGNPVSGEDGLILRVVDILALFSGAIAIIIIILAGLRFVTAAGSTEDIAGARRTLIYAVVGLVIIVISRTLVGLIVTRL
jgi:hypothetical protein